MDYREKQELLRNRVRLMGLGVSLTKSRFPPIDGIEQKVKLRAKKEGTYYHIPFLKENNYENTIYGNIADRLLNDFPELFEIIEVNGIPYEKGVEEVKDKEIVEKVMQEITKNYDLVPKKKDTARNKHSEEPEDKSDYTNDKLKAKGKNLLG